MNILLLASQSRARRDLLSEAEISFVQLEQSADEKECDWTLPLPQLVASVAKYKMEQVIMPLGSKDRELYVLTADTLTEDKQGLVLGKPENREHALTMLRSIRSGARVGTAFCLEKKVYRFEQWQTRERIIDYVEAHCVFSVPEEKLNEYLDNSPALSCSGAFTLDGYGAQFFKSISGSYTTILGLPMCELRKALEKIGFFGF
jgi:septum formation protein